MICKRCGAENAVNAPLCSLCLNPLLEPSARTEMWASAAAPRTPAAPEEFPGRAASPQKPSAAFSTRLYGIVGAEKMTTGQLQQELRKGGRIVRYRYSIGALLYAFKNDSTPHLIKAGKSAFTPGLKYSLLSFLLGWWGIPMGPLYTPAVIFSNLAGGEDITYEYTARMETAEKRAAARLFNPYETVEPYCEPDFHDMPV